MTPRLMALAIAFAIGLAAGAGAVRYMWNADELRDARLSAAKLKELQRDKDQAICERDALLDSVDASARDNRALLERLRIAERTMPVSTSGACERQLAECRQLLSEGADLLAEGSALVGKLSADRTAVRRLVQ